MHTLYALCSLLTEIAGDYTFGMLGRGSDSEISLYKNSLLTSELGTNITESALWVL